MIDTVGRILPVPRRGPRPIAWVTGLECCPPTCPSSCSSPQKPASCQSIGGGSRYLRNVLLNYNSRENLGCSRRSSEQAPQMRKRPQLSLAAKKALLSKADRSKRTDDREVGDMKLAGFHIQFKGVTPKLCRGEYFLNIWILTYLESAVWKKLHIPSVMFWRYRHFGPEAKG